jgi:two-component sensor histidine kinase
LNRYIFSFTLFLNFFLLVRVQAKEPNSHINIKSNENINAIKLLKIWDSVNKLADYISDPYSIQQWETYLNESYEIATKSKNYDLAFRLSIPLSYIYHSETKFSKGIPLLEAIYTRKAVLSNDILKQILIKLEEEYRGTNNIEKAILIRKERIANNFINNYWEIYRDCGLYEAAKKDLLQFEKKPNKNTIALLQYHFLLGGLYFEMKQLDSAKKEYNIGLIETRKMIEDRYVTDYNIGKLKYWEACFMGLTIKCNIANGDFNKAIPTLLHDINNSIENTDNKTDMMIELSKCYIHNKSFNIAKIYLDSAEKLLLEKISKPLKLTFLSTKSEFYKAIFQYDSALMYYKAYNNYRDTLQKNLQQNQSILLLAQMEITNRRTELLESKQSLIESIKENDRQKIILLVLLFFLITSVMLTGAIYVNNIAKSKSKDKIEAQNIMINAHAEKIEAQFDHNQILLKELHHRVKNNLQVMYSLLNLQKRRNKDIDTIETLASIQNRIHTMALVHQNLYNSGDFELVEILNYIKTLSDHLSTIYKIDKQKIDLKLEINENIKLPIETVVAIGLIINEAASNSFKYAFKNKIQGELLIKTVCIENSIEVTIQDNGEGIKIINAKDNSLGMKLIDLMCLQLKATHTLEHTNGVTHFIKFYIV